MSYSKEQSYLLSEHIEHFWFYFLVVSREAAPWNLGRSGCHYADQISHTDISCKRTDERAKGGKTEAQYLCQDVLPKQ